jgi:tetratricopeptide (TPR) repeat protein
MRSQHLKYSENSFNYLKEAEKLVFASKHREALALLLKIEENDTELSKVLRLKSYAQLGSGDIQGSFATLQNLAEQHDCLIDDIFAAGERALELAKYDFAENYLSRVLRHVAESEDIYYMQTCLAERAFARICLGKISLAKEDANAVDIDTQIDWLADTVLITKQSLLASIEKAS